MRALSTWRAAGEARGLLAPKRPCSKQKPLLVIPAKESVDFRHGRGSLPLEKGGQEGFSNDSIEQILPDPPFSKEGTFYQKSCLVRVGSSL